MYLSSTSSMDIARQSITCASIFLEVSHREGYNVRGSVESEKSRRERNYTSDQRGNPRHEILTGTESAATFL